jgi:hypothetical protein
LGAPLSRTFPRATHSIVTPEAALSYKLSLDALSVDSFEAGSYAAIPGTVGRDCTDFPVCQRTDTTDAAAREQDAVRLPAQAPKTYEPGCTAFPELCPIGTSPTG